MPTRYPDPKPGGSSGFRASGTPAPDHPDPADHWPLPPALAASRRRLSLGGLYAALYESRPMGSVRFDSNAHPLLLIHGVHLTASAADAAPLFERCAASRPVIAVELPGFGSSSRGRIECTPELMVAAILRAVEHVRTEGLRNPVDLVAMALSCEFAARAAMMRPHWFRSVAMISPTGLEGGRVEPYDADATCGVPLLRGVIERLPFIDPLFRIFVRPATVRSMLRRSSGLNRFDRAFIDYGVAAARQAGACHAPLWAMTGALRTPGVVELYARLPQPVWIAHGVRGLSAAYDGLARIGPPSHWTVDVFGTGAWPHFEAPELVFSRYEAFLASLGAGTRAPVQPGP